MLPIASRRLGAALGLALGAALSLASSPARAQERGMIDGFDVATILTVPGQIFLLPAYASSTYYVIRSDKRMPLPWLIANGLGVASSGSLGVLAMAISIDEASGLEDDRTEAFAVALGSSTLLVGGAAFVASASLVSFLRPERGPAPGAPAARSLRVLPLFLPSASAGRPGAGLALAGAF